MGKKLYVGNLAFATSEEEVRTAFSVHGEVTKVDIVTDRDTGRPRGFAFVEMATDEGAKAAVAALNGTSLGGRAIQVDEARPQKERTGGGGRDRRGPGRGDRDRRPGGSERW